MLTSIVYSPSPCAVDLDFLVRFSRLTTNNDIDQLLVFAQVATEAIENHISRFLVTRDITWTIARNTNHSVANSNWAAFGAGWNWMMLQNRWISLPRQATAVSSVVFGQWDGNSPDVVLNQDVDYNLDLATDPGRIKMLTWANQYLFDHMQVVLTSGYGPNIAAIPKAIKQAVLMLALRLYENRGDAETALMNEAIKNLLASYVTPCFGY